MNRARTPILIFLLLACFGAAPKASIEAPKSAACGTLVVLKPTGAVFDSDWIIWTKVSGDCDAVEGINHEYVFAQGTPGTVVVAQACFGMVDGVPKGSFAVASVPIGGKPVPPTPVPPAPDPPGPSPNPQPDDKFHLARVVVNAGARLSAPAKALMPAIGDNFQQAANAATNGQITTIQGLNTDVFTRNTKTMGTQKALFTPLSDDLQVALQNAHLTTLADGVQAFKEIAAGCKAVKQNYQYLEEIR